MIRMATIAAALTGILFLSGCGTKIDPIYQYYLNYNKDQIQKQDKMMEQ